MVMACWEIAENVLACPISEVPSRMEARYSSLHVILGRAELHGLHNAGVIGLSK